MSTDEKPARSGRPRLLPAADTELSPKEQILNAAAALFVENGFSATSTRAIAERVGIRQASLYYHFGSKEEIFSVLLNASVHPSLEALRLIEARVPALTSPAAALHALAVIDTRTLLQTAHNIAILWLLPEVQTDTYDDFRLEREELSRAYGRLGFAAATDTVTSSITQDQLGAMLIQLTELISQLRRTSEPEATYPEAIAASCLRLCGLEPSAVAAAVAESQELLSSVSIGDDVSVGEVSDGDVSDGDASASGNKK